MGSSVLSFLLALQELATLLVLKVPSSGHGSAHFIPIQCMPNSSSASHRCSEHSRKGHTPQTSSSTTTLMQDPRKRDSVRNIQKTSPTKHSRTLARWSLHTDVPVFAHVEIPLLITQHKHPRNSVRECQLDRQVRASARLKQFSPLDHHPTCPSERACGST